MFRLKISVEDMDYVRSGTFGLLGSGQDPDLPFTTGAYNSILDITIIIFTGNSKFNFELKLVNLLLITSYFLKKSFQSFAGALFCTLKVFFAFASCYGRIIWKEGSGIIHFGLWTDILT